MEEIRDHGGNLDAAIARLGGAPDHWLDLSTGINPNPYPVPPIPADAWAVLPRKSDIERLCHAAASAYKATARVIPMNGAQGVIQAVPWVRAPGRATVLGPTYNEHAAALRNAGWQVEEVATLDALAGGDLAVVVNPNNPDGQCWNPEHLRALAARVGLLVVDESFVDAQPELSMATHQPKNAVILRSFGKFYGLAGVRLGFALAHAPLAEKLVEIAGPWPVSGPAIEIAETALLDTDWQAENTARLCAGAARMDALACRAGWSLVGGTPLFRTYDTGDAHGVQETLAKHRVWSRIFPYSTGWIRLGLPPQDRWAQLETTLTETL